MEEENVSMRGDSDKFGMESIVTQVHVSGGAVVRNESADDSECVLGDMGVHTSDGDSSSVKHDLTQIIASDPSGSAINQKLQALTAIQELIDDVRKNRSSLHDLLRRGKADRRTGHVVHAQSAVQTGNSLQVAVISDEETEAKRDTLACLLDKHMEAFLAEIQRTLDPEALQVIARLCGFASQGELLTAITRCLGNELDQSVSAGVTVGRGGLEVQKAVAAMWMRVVRGIRQKFAPVLNDSGMARP